MTEILFQIIGLIIVPLSNGSNIFFPIVTLTDIPVDQSSQAVIAGAIANTGYLVPIDVVHSKLNIVFKDPNIYIHTVKGPHFVVMPDVGWTLADLSGKKLAHLQHGDGRYTLYTLSDILKTKSLTFNLDLLYNRSSFSSSTANIATNIAADLNRSSEIAIIKVGNYYNIKEIEDFKHALNSSTSYSPTATATGHYSHPENIGPLNSYNYYYPTDNTNGFFIGGNVQNGLHGSQNAGIHCGIYDKHTSIYASVNESPLTGEKKLMIGVGFTITLF